MTSVLSYADPPHKIGVLFKGKTARVLEGLNAPAWMLLQHQDSGSYRTCNVVDFLNHALPDATRPEESIIVMLDWFAAHLSDEVSPHV
jgi:hypothetical protein